MGRGKSKAGKSGSKPQLNNSVKHNGKEGSIAGLKRDLQGNNQTKPQYKIVIDPQTIRQHGFKSANQLQEYKNNQYFSSGVSVSRKNSIQIEDASWGGKNTAIVKGRNDAANFVKYLKNNLNVGVESYGNNSWFVKLDRDASLVKKKKKKK